MDNLTDEPGVLVLDHFPSACLSDIGQLVFGRMYLSKFKDVLREEDWLGKKGAEERLPFIEFFFLAR